jgi:AcrR family transcriptional regulator
MYDQTKLEKRHWSHNEDNRARLIAAGHTLLAEKGIEATTVKEIARLAGVSPGLFHYYFASKDELLLAVLYRAGAQYGEQLVQDLQASLSSQPFPAMALVAAHEVGHKDPAWYRLRYELYAMGLRHPHMLPAVGKYLATSRKAMSDTIGELTGMGQAQAEAMAMVLLACTDGLALQQLAQPDLDLTAAYALVQRLISSESPSPPEA